MITCTISLCINSVNVHLGSDGKQCASGIAEFQQYDDTALIPYFATGDSYEAIASAGKYSKGIAIGFINVSKVNGKAAETLVIREFYVTNRNHSQAVAAPLTAVGCS